MQHIFLYFDKSNIQDFVLLGFSIIFFKVLNVKLSHFAYARTLSLFLSLFHSLRRGASFSYRKNIGKNNKICIYIHTDSLYVVQKSRMATHTSKQT